MTDMEKIEDHVLESDHPPETHSIDTELEDVIEPKIGFFHTLSEFLGGIFHSKHKVGELNGKWAALFKMVLVLVVLIIPTFFAWATWVTNETFATKYHRLQTDDFENRISDLESNIKLLNRVELELSRIFNKIDSWPTEDWRRRIDILETNQTEASNKLDYSNQKNQDEHNKILVLLEGIKTTVDILKQK